MKLLVLAVNAQLRAFSGRKEKGAIHNGIWARPSLREAYLILRDRVGLDLLKDSVLAIE